MKKLTIVLFVLTSCILASGQKPNVKGPQFDISDFNAKFETAQWLVEYDGVAWKTTDVLMQQNEKDLERLGPEWFCFQDKDKIWHAVYGKLTQGRYEAVFHYVRGPGEKITKSDTKIDQDFLNRHAIALSTSREKLMTSIPENSPRFNQYIRQNPDKTFSVWMLPAFQPDGTAVYGGEAVYTLDASGTKLIKDESYFQKNLRGFASQPPREIWLNYTEMEKPSLGAIFFVWYYKSYFTQILIDNVKTTSTVIGVGGNFVWTHVEKDANAKPSEQDDPKPRLERKKPADRSKRPAKGILTTG